MLNETRNQAKGQATAKEDELMRIKMDLLNYQQQV